MDKGEMEKAYTVFGDLFKNFRIRNGKTLRAFCIEFGFDMENISKIERGIYPPPDDRSKLLEYADSLALEEGSDDWIAFFDLAARADRSESRVASYRNDILERLPILFRTQDNRDIDDGKLDEIVEIVRES